MLCVFGHQFISSMCVCVCVFEEIELVRIEAFLIKRIGPHLNWGIR